MSSAHPPMVYDYHGFPPHTFQITYPAPGAPDIARRAADLIAAAGVPTRLDDQQGFDHGTFVPAYVMYPDASVPLFQVSLRKGYGPAEHFALGRALAPLRDEGVLIIGSGLSYHNLRLFGPGAKEPSEAFDAWLAQTMAAPPAQRTERLLHWESAPYARVCHKEEDHFVPLFAALGAAEGEAATMVYHDTDLFGGVTASSYRIG
jgi:aromatic ring-opening dioxygenase catalytic subunit (LigB family)